MVYENIFFICTILFHISLKADIGPGGQFTQCVFPLSTIYKRASQICKEKGFRYFLIKSMSYKDQQGQTFLFKGISEAKEGILLSDTITEKFDPSIGELTVNFELFFFKQAPRNVLAIKEGAAVDIGKGNSLDQFQHFIFPLFAPHYRALEICQAKGFSHYILKKVAYKDERGQLLEFKGTSQSNLGVSLAESITQEFKAPIGTLTVEFEGLFFQDPPDEPLAIGFTQFMDWLFTDSVVIFENVTAYFKELLLK